MFMAARPRCCSFRVGALLPFMLLGGLLMLLPAIGYDAAHRPEAWWFRMAIVLTLLLGPVVSAGWWLLLPSLLVCAGFLTVLPWWLEGEANTDAPPAVWLSALILLTSLSMLAYRPEPQHQVLTGLCACFVIVCGLCLPKELVISEHGLNRRNMHSPWRAL